MLVLLLSSCGRGRADMSDYDHEVYTPKYATGFEILGADDCESTIIVTKSPWQGSDESASTKILISRDGEAVPAGFDGQVVKAPIERIVCMSSSHVAIIDALGDIDRVVGVSGIDFIQNHNIQQRRDQIADYGYDDGLDYERLVASDPDIVLVYGVFGANKIEPKLRELGIPFMYISEYLEENPLGKSEWLVAVGELLDKRDYAEGLYEGIPKRYEALRQQAQEVSGKPAVMLNTPYGDSWLMPSSNSYLVRLIEDAGGRYVYTGNTSNKSMPIDMEEAYALASESDVWLNTGRFSKMKELVTAYPKFADTKPVATGRVWNCTLRSTPGGGNDFWESGVVNPDLVLQDLIKILHPELPLNGEMTYYQRLE